MQQLINVHCHLLNFRFALPRFFKRLQGLPEKLLRHKATRWLGSVVILALWLFQKGGRLIKLLGFARIVSRDIEDVARALDTEMKLAGRGNAQLVLATPLMMDLEQGYLGLKPDVAYAEQIERIAAIALEYPGRLMPFVMFDPRRQAAAGLVKTALEAQGFLGVKIYPPLGYHPDPSAGYVPKGYDPDKVNAQLRELYRYCQQNQIPITTHCSRGGAYSADLVLKPQEAQRLTHPSSWAGVLRQYPGLHLNFAHFGGKDDEFLEHDNPDSWCSAILRLMERYGHVYADVSYNDGALREKTAQRYFGRLAELLGRDPIGKRILFGTDWLMTRHAWTEAEYLAPFRAALDDSQLRRLAFENPLDFLFPGRRLPDRLKRFYAPRAKPLPAWMAAVLS